MAKMVDTTRMVVLAKLNQFINQSIVALRDALKFFKEGVIFYISTFLYGTKTHFYF